MILITFFSLLNCCLFINCQQLSSSLFLDFNSDSDLTNYFNKETGNNNGWGNHELQTYTTDSASVSNGNLVITTSKSGNSYKSARLLSKNSFQYGSFEMRAKLPRGRGTWPAFWLLAAKRPLNWAQDGEIDIMEHVGYDMNRIHGTVHYGSVHVSSGNSRIISSADTSFHLYQLYWTPTQIKISVDNTEIHTFNKEPNANYDKWPFDNSMNIIINMAVGGDWGGSNDVDDSVFPTQYVIDYVRYTPLNTFDWNNDQSTGIKWALGCDWTGNDLKNEKIQGSACAAKCVSISGCTHFTWTNWNGGTCWMKSGSVDYQKAVRASDSSAVCGYRY